MTDTPAAIPKHVGVIVDGNRRWAKSKGLPIIEGHRQGYQLLKSAADWLFSKGVKQLSAFIFSTENWNRSRQEVEDLMDLARWVLKNEAEKMHKKGVQIRVSGLKERVSEDILELIDQVTEKTKHNQQGTLNLCFNYGGRPDIIQAVKRLIQKGLKADEVSEQALEAELSTAGLLKVDMVIRPSEHRLSNFLIWEAAYAELYFIEDKLWPDMSEQDFDKALAWFASRQRRFGG